MDITAHNRAAWDHRVRVKNGWTVPVEPDEVARARGGDVRIVLTPSKHVPSDWLQGLSGRRVLCLAAGGGQQAPLLAAAGASVTVFDNSPAQLEHDRLVAEREGLEIQRVLGDMSDLRAFESESFDLIVHPCSNSFVPDVHPVWAEASRVLRPGGHILSGFSNPVIYIFDDSAAAAGKLVVRHALPYSDLTSLTDTERQEYIDKNEPLCFGHTLQDQIGGQLEVGLVLVGFYEDSWRPQDAQPLAAYMPTFCATRARKA